MSGRDFRALLSVDKFWDAQTQALFDAHGEPLEDCILQNREEVIRLCELIERQRIRSYLEIGIWTGRLVSTLHRLFDFDLVAACDHGWAERCGLAIRVPPDCRLFRGESDSDQYRTWRAGLGHVDLVFIDASHNYHAVRRDFAINRRFPNRFLAFHDIAGATRQTAGVGRFWRELTEGHKLDIVAPHLEVGPAAPAMGIGIWSPSEPV
jgi:hypothetical protein